MNKKLTCIAYGFIAIAMSAILGILINKIVEAARGIDKDKLGDAATWIGAIGTILAFFGTIWIATADRRERHRDKMNFALIVSDRVSVDIEKTLNAVNEIYISLRDAVDTNIPPEHLPECAESLRKLGKWQQEDIIALIPLPQKCASKLLNTSRIIKEVSEMFAIVPGNHPNLVAQWRTQVNLVGMAMLNDAGIELKQALDICKNARESDPVFS